LRGNELRKLEINVMKSDEKIAKMDQSIKARLADPSTGKKRKEFLDRFVKGEFSSLKTELAQHKEETKSFL
jgi:predicted RNA-binding protein with RPS1 domain